MFVLGVVFVLLIDVLLLQHHLLKRLFFLHWIDFELSRVNRAYLCWSTVLGSVLLFFPLIYVSITPQYMYVLVAPSCPTLCTPLDCSPPGSSVLGILQASILECSVIYFSRGTSWPWDRTWVSCIIGIFFTIWATRKDPIPPQNKVNNQKNPTTLLITSAIQ